MASAIDLLHEGTVDWVTTSTGARVLAFIPKKQAIIAKWVGKAVQLALRRYRHTRSNQQNRYYWGVVIHLLAEELGYDPDELHEEMAMKFLRIENSPITGSPRRLSTALLTTMEFESYVGKVREWGMRFLATEEGRVFYIPLPNEIVDWSEYPEARGHAA